MAEKKEALVMSQFAIVPLEVVMDDRLTKMQLKVLIAILSCRNRNSDTAFPKREKLSARCGYSVQTISKVTAQLEQLGWIEKKGKGGYSKATEYRITVPDLATVPCETVSEPGTVSDLDISDDFKPEDPHDTGLKTVTGLDTVDSLDTVPESAKPTVSELANKTVSEPDTRKEHTIEHTNEHTSSNNTTGGQGYFEMYPDWHPSDLAFHLTDRRCISRAFAEDSVPEFVLYWCGRPGKAYAGAWDQRFLKHCIRQWVKYEAAVEHDSAPKLIPESWTPTVEVFEVLKTANIDPYFAEELVPEFILYWRERREVSASWNTKFLQHVKWHWAHRQEDKGDFIERVTDRSWAA